MNRDWQEDMEYCNRFDDGGQYLVWPKVLKHWLQQAATEKKRADKLDKAVKEAIEICEGMKDTDDPLEILEKVLIQMQLVVSLSRECEA
ncbi:hypothetical protein MNQ98_24535 [Paenibacillus sp. N3/727]|uniref:hypothetical protein n=1 Tax=Paenibacillus sp. N3/727 TaxID=2925845 RepID=UPI001F535C44|nr:hypothetical protein [Paenibacillus sp. N3/727]UNK17591.1 hypothetical protein MNQ98_24535 [Paenibacillus sp. N3/727]